MRQDGWSLAEAQNMPCCGDKAKSGDKWRVVGNEEVEQDENENNHTSIVLRQQKTSGIPMFFVPSIVDSEVRYWHALRLTVGLVTQVAVAWQSAVFIFQSLGSYHKTLARCVYFNMW